MFGKRRIIATQRALALFLKKYKNESYRQIARECGISKSSAARICIHDGSDKFIGVLNRVLNDDKGDNESKGAE